MAYIDRSLKIERLFKDKAEREERDRKWAFLFTLITVIGSAAVGAGLMLSEILFAEIEEFSECPQWYRAFFLLSLCLAVTGTLGCSVVKKPLSGKLFVKYLKEQYFYFGVMSVGFIIMVAAAFITPESFALDVTICFGGALCSFGLFAFIGASMGFLLSAKNNKYLKLLNKFRAKNGNIKLAEFAYQEFVCELEQELRVNLPAELIDFYLQSDGDGALLYCAAGALHVTEVVRQDDAPFNPEILSVLCIGDDGEGNCFCYKINDGAVTSDTIYVIERESLKLLPVAGDLTSLITLYYGGYLANINERGHFADFNKE